MLPVQTPVLIVDDSETALQYLEGLVRGLGFQSISSARDGAEALAKLETQALQKQPIGLVLADWNMPGMTGIELLRTLRNSAQHAELPFIMITADSEMDMIVQAISAGVSSYIVKPVTAEGLRSKLAAVFSTKKG